MAAVLDNRGIVLPGDLETYPELVVTPKDSGFGACKSFCLAQDLGNGLVAIPRFYPKHGLEPVQRYVSEIDPDFPRFEGGLDPSRGQHEAFDRCVEALRTSGGCVLSLAVGYGKTVVALAVAAELRVKVAVLVHTRVLLDQWRDRIARFFPGARVGEISGSRCDLDGHFVLSMLQTAGNRIRDLDTSSFGLTIVDEAHHIAAPTFSRAMVGLSCRYVLGLSATPERKDGLTRLIHWYLGPVCMNLQRRDQAYVTVKKVRYSCPRYSAQPPVAYNGRVNLTSIVTLLTKDSARNSLIADHIAEAAANRRCVLALTDRRDHAKLLRALVLLRVPESVRVDLYLGGSKAAALQETSQNADVIIGTYSIAHEGLDIPRLNALVMCTPKGDVVQACGRIMRDSSSDVSPLIVDIVDSWGPLVSQSAKRDSYYRRTGFATSA